MAAMPEELRRLIEARKAQVAAGTAGPGGAPGGASGPPGATVAATAATAASGAAASGARTSAPAGLGEGGHQGPLPATHAYRRQGANNNGVLLIALPSDTFANDAPVQGFLEFTATDDEYIASIVCELVEINPREPGGHVWDRVLVRQGPWRAKRGDVLPLPFSLRLPAGTSPSSRRVQWEVRAMVDINWALDVEATSPITMRNLDLERIRDALGGLDYRVGDFEAEAMGQRWAGVFHPPAQLAGQLGINEIGLLVEYLGANLKVVMKVDKKGVFKRDRQNQTVFELARLRAAPLAELTAMFARQIDDMMAQ
jgi:hypothetical protein